ncbi:uncharacterized protein C5orf47 homolog [Fukomys damarensis]|uniref:uncharacterized protein C5orf47 homolog n=1 Tax=Fukomys damarensis TaxID=885580 RepID=UPI00053FD1B9|nr:uncharacterized protein C5orf47 homolog [Fukomys damarensis]
MLPAGRARKQYQARFIYVTRFGSHQCGGGQLAVSHAALPGPAAVASRGRLVSCSVSQASLLSANQSAESYLTQKDAATVFDFPIQLCKACKIMKKRKKASVWNSVYKVISRMLEENEKYRLRLKCQRSSNENSKCTR